jgi:CheY-like chemotaxis protein
MKAFTDKTILLVEDNPDDVELNLRALRQFNISNQVTVASDGVEALVQLFGTGDQPPPHPPPAVILLDLKLPKVSGLEVLRRVRESPRTRLIPVIILTSSQEEKDLMAGYDLGCNSYIRKPIDFVEFVTAVRQLGMYWLLLNETPPLRNEV